MALHKPFDRHFFTIGGAVKTNGGSLNLSKGQFGIFNVNKTTKDGVTALSSFKGLPKNTKLELRLGKSDLPVTRSQTNKSFSSFPFSLKDVKDVSVSAPESTEQSVDEVIIGYNGIDCNTKMDFTAGETSKIVLRLEGEAMGLLGYPMSMVDIPVYIDTTGCSPFHSDCITCDPCDAPKCKPLVLQAIEVLKNHQLRGGVKVSDFVDITPVLECTTSEDLTLIPYNYYCLDVCDTGDDSALSLVQVQYPDVKISRKGRNGAISTYEFLAPASDPAPADYEQTLPSLIKGCEDCPEGYEEVEGGFVYAVCLEDDGIDEASTVEGLANAVAGTAIKADAQDKGTGYYTVVLTEKLSDEDLATFLGTAPTAIVDYVGETADVCNSDTVTTVAWAVCGTCNATEQCYVLDLPDTECGEDRLAEVQAAYPDLEVEIALDADGAEIKGGCQTRYKVKVVSNLVCEECDPIFLDTYRTEAPEGFDGRTWKFFDPNVVLVDGEDCECPAPEENDECCKCGIRVKGKEIEVCPTECLRDMLGFLSSSVKIRISGGFLTEVRANETKVDKPFHTEYISRAVAKTHMGGNMWDYEDRSRVFFTGEGRHTDLVARMFKGEESHIDACKQYVDYAITIERNHFSQSFSGKECETITYHVLAEAGRHADVEELINSLAVSAGCTPVFAFAKR